MKFYMDLPWGGHLCINRELKAPKEPMEDGKFAALVGLAAFALLILWFLGGEALKRLT